MGKIIDQENHSSEVKGIEIVSWGKKKEKRKEYCVCSFLRESQRLSYE